MGLDVRVVLVCGLMAATLAPPVALAAQERAVRGVLFHSPTCPHCRKVIEVDLPPLHERYGSSLALVGVDVSTEYGAALYRATIEHFHIPADRTGVPTLVVGTEILVGSVEIPARLPGLVRAGLEAGGVGWPPVEAVREMLAGRGFAGPDSAAAPPRAGAHPGPGGAGDPLDAPAPTALDRFRRDPVGNSLAAVVLLGTLVALALSVGTVTGAIRPIPTLPSGMVPLLGIAGTAVAAYLAWVETTGAPAVCGPVGDCNAVQQSEWARLFGVVPVGALGVAGYLGMGGAWLLAVRGGTDARRRAWRALWAMAFGGTAFSAWLTYLEPFVLGATCAWCLSSTVIVSTLLLVASTRVAFHGVAVEPAAAPG